MLTRKEKAKAIVDILSSASFAKWYNEGDFDKWITGNVPKVTDDEILEQTAKRFNLHETV